MRDLNCLDEQEKKELFDSVDTYLCDCDGVVWLGKNTLPGAVDVVNRLKELGKNVLFVTNNSTKTRSDLLRKCKKLGFKLDIDGMITSAWLTAAYLNKLNFNKKAYVVGNKAIYEELNQVGIKSFGYGPDHYPEGSTIEENFICEPDVAAVVVGHDIYFSFPKMLKACTYLSDPDCLFIGTNPDPSLPFPGNRIAPGAGSFVKSVETCSGREPIIVGKPSKIAVEEVLKTQGLDPSRSIMIGDRCITDIAFGNECSMKTLFVRSGIDTLDIIKDHEKNNRKHLVPTYYADSIADLFKVIEAGLKK